MIQQEKFSTLEVVYISVFFFFHSLHLFNIYIYADSMACKDDLPYRNQCANMPAMPYQASWTPIITTKLHKMPNNGQPQNVIMLIKEAIEQSIKDAKVLITQVVFSKNAMMYSRNRKKDIVNKSITDSVPQFYRLDGEFVYH
jgi:hypothetical protein